METVLVYFVVIVGNLVSAGVRADINCGPPPVVRRAIVIAGADKDVYRPESLLLYKCQAGYFSDVTVFSSKCKLSGNIAEWTRPNIRCRRVTCDVPRSPKNGRAIYSSITYPAEVTYECNEGYYLSNQQRRFCSADGTWNGTEPVCSDNLCSLPRAPENGFFNLMSLKPEIGSTVAYSCKNGFKLEGSATSECAETRRWTNSIPRCLRLPKMCEPPVAPENGLFNLTPDKPEAGSTVKYSCRDGFRLHGSATSECSEEGTWTNPAPRCFFITDSCKVPEVLPHGEIGMYKVVPHPQYVYFLKYENISAGTIVADGEFVLKCEGTYKPRGSGGQEKRIECRDGTWLDELQCVSENSCELPVIPENVFYLAPEKLEFGSFIRYYCKDGFRLQGSAESVCRTTGRWSQLPPTCLKNSCELPVIPENVLYHAPEKLEFGSFIRYYCKPGFRLQGPAESVCRTTGRWSQLPPTCLIIPENGFYRTPEKVEFESIIEYSCKDGCRLLGFTESVCRTTGTRSHPTPTCLKISCELPVIPENVLYRAPEKLEFGSIIKYSCRDGFILQGYWRSLCYRTGTWSHPTPTCLSIRKFFEEEGNRTTTTQPSIRSSTEGKINVNGTKPDNKLCYCEYNNPDEHLVAYCEYIILHNGDKVKSNCTVKFFCKDAEYYRLRGPREITCTNCQPFHWTQYPKCMERNRREPCFMEALFSRLPEGVMLKTEERQPETVPYGTTLELTCASNDDTMKHITNFSPMATCNATWIVPRVLCYRPCRLTLRANSTLIVVPKKDLYLFGQAAMFSCPKGQTLTPDIRVMMCLSGGWSANPIPHCEDR